VEALGGPPSPERLAGADDETLRGAGLSRSKLKALRDLAHKVTSGEVSLEDLDAQTDAEVERRLTRVWGIGTWTAHMFLMFHLQRPDVWPVGDLGVRQGYALLHGLSEPVPAAEMTQRGDAYRPWRSAAAWYCWRALETELP
jgi:3-methyladenine DNA glycosylase/8-oxoguanine DNA glycosylase